MSCNYAEGLSPYDNKGKLGGPEKFDTPEEVEEKVSQLAEWVKNSRHIVVHTGAGISTSAGIPDFRGPKGVWTLEKKGLKPEMNVSWDDAKPTPTHMALARLVEEDKVKFIITQNIDGLHLRSGVPRKNISELHGNMFVDQCDKCKKMLVRDSPAPTVGQKNSGVDCPAHKDNGRKCRGKLKDFVLDWEDNLPDDDLTISDTHSMMADLSIVMGSTLQIIPAGNMPTYTKKYQETGKLVICNLQPTKHLKKADLNIHTYVDDVMKLLMNKLGLDIPEYNPDTDPVRHVRFNRLPDVGYIDFTQCSDLARKMKKVGDKIDDSFKEKRKNEKKRKYIEQNIEKNNKMRKRTENGMDQADLDEPKHEIEIIEIKDPVDSKDGVKPELEFIKDCSALKAGHNVQKDEHAKVDFEPEVMKLEVNKDDKSDLDLGIKEVAVIHQVDDSDDSSIKEESNDSGILLITTKSPVVANSLKPCSETLSTSERALVNAEQDSLTDESSSSSVEVLDAPVDSRVLC